MKRISLLLACLFLAGLLAGCGGSADYSGDAGAPAEKEEAYENGFVSQDYDTDASTADPGETPQPADPGQLKLVYTGSISIQSMEYDATVADLKALIAAYHCLVESAEESDYDSSWRDAAYSSSARDCTWVIRVPSASFQELMEKLGTVHGHVESKNQSAEDMTRRFRDNESRIASLKAQEERLLSFMENASTISETLEIEDRLSEVRYELEQLQNANNDIDFMAQYSKLTVRVQEVVEYDTTGMSFSQRVGQAFSDSTNGFVRALQGTVILFIWLLPYLVIAAVVILILFLTRGRRAARRSAWQESRRQKKELRLRRKQARRQNRGPRPPMPPQDQTPPDQPPRPPEEEE